MFAEHFLLDECWTDVKCEITLLAFVFSYKIQTNSYVFGCSRNLKQTNKQTKKLICTQRQSNNCLIIGNQRSMKWTRIVKIRVNLRTVPPHTEVFLQRS